MNKIYMSEKEKFAISEAKDFLMDKRAAISKTTGRAWQLIGFVIAANVYLIEAAVDDGNHLQKTIAATCLAFSVAIWYNLNGSLFPMRTGANGGRPERLAKIVHPDNSEYCFDAIMATYSKNIKQNEDSLDRLVDSYKTALNLFYWFVVVSVFFVFLFMLVEPDASLGVR